MAKNTFLSPGVYTRENDLSYLPQKLTAVGAAFVGPTVRGPAMVPIQISTYSEYLRWFGDLFASGSGQTKLEYKYLTTYAVQEYLRYGEVATVIRILAGSYGPAYSYVVASGSYYAVPSSSASYAATDMCFKLSALSDGDISNSGTAAASISGSGVAADITTGGLLVSGSSYNMRWEIANVNQNRGTFDLYIRRGDDIDSRKVILEQYNQVTLDAKEPNFISKVIGDMTWTLRYDSSGAPYLQKSGSYQNRSRFIRCEVIKNTLNYLNDNGTIRDTNYTASMPAAVSGTFSNGSEGNVTHPRALYGDIWNSNTQGFNLASSSSAYGAQAYQDAIDILSNKDQYDINLLFMPGLIDGLAAHATLLTRAINMCEDRGDVMLVMDPTYFGSTVGQAQNAAEARNTNYAAIYYPWCQIPDADLGRNVWVPPSAIISGVYSFNDKIAHPWYAPAGLNRGQLDQVIQTERLMTQNDRDNLYQVNVNPIASFPKTGMAIWGQKTLQKKKSALDRINVRRLLIDAKRFIAETTKYLVFENNTVETRQKFIEITDPYFRNVKALQGLYDYRIVIDERNNTPDVIDRNEMRASIWLKPAKTVEFLIVDFNILPTGALFPYDAKS